jgi:hypothetical protein
MHRALFGGFYELGALSFIEAALERQHTVDAIDLRVARLARLPAANP